MPTDSVLPRHNNNLVINFLQVGNDLLNFSLTWKNICVALDNPFDAFKGLLHDLRFAVINISKDVLLVNFFATCCLIINNQEFVSFAVSNVALAATHEVILSLFVIL